MVNPLEPPGKQLYDIVRARKALLDEMIGRPSTDMVPYTGGSGLPGSVSEDHDLEKAIAASLSYSTPPGAAGNSDDDQLSQAVEMSMAEAAAAPKPGQPATLRNLGNTCYGNAVLQSLFHTRDIREAVLTLPDAEALITDSVRGIKVAIVVDVVVVIVIVVVTPIAVYTIVSINMHDGNQAIVLPRQFSVIRISSLCMLFIIVVIIAIISSVTIVTSSGVLAHASDLWPLSSQNESAGVSSSCQPCNVHSMRWLLRMDPPSLRQSSSIIS